MLAPESFRTGAGVSPVLFEVGGLPFVGGDDTELLPLLNEDAFVLARRTGDQAGCKDQGDKTSQDRFSMRESSAD